MKAKAKKINNKWFAVLENGNRILIKNSDVKKHSLKEDLEIEGEIKQTTEQIKYTNGEYSRSYIEIDVFEIKNEK